MLAAKLKTLDKRLVKSLLKSVIQIYTVRIKSVVPTLQHIN